MFAVHQNLTIMKPVLIISDDRARILLASFFAYRGYPTMCKFVHELSADVVKELLSIVLDEASKLDGHEESGREN